jgi:SAM-dependent methyltransferase
MIRELARKIFSEKQRIDMLMFGMRLKSLAYIGNNFYCNCCGKTFSRFLTYGYVPRTHALCPWCHSLERTRLLLCYLERETSVFKEEKKILHFAPEWVIRKNLRKSASRKGYVTADINPALADHVVDITKITFPDNSFDLIICSHVLGHVDDEALAIDEMFRVLKPGGEALIMTVLDLNNPVTLENPSWTTPSERLAHYGEPDLLRLHGLDFRMRLQREGVKVEEIDYTRKLSDSENRHMSTGNRERELIFRCIKIIPGIMKNELLFQGASS